MLDPSNRFATLVLALGTVVLLAAIAVGESMGDRVLGQATEHGLPPLAAALASPDANPSTGPYGPDWKRSEALAAASDPGFPDPRVPPRPLPTLPPATPTPKPPPATPTPNPNIPIWRQQPLPSPSPSAIPSPAETPVEPSPSPAPPGDAGSQGSRPPP